MFLYVLGISNLQFERLDTKRVTSKTSSEHPSTSIYQMQAVKSDYPEIIIWCKLNDLYTVLLVQAQYLE